MAWMIISNTKNIDGTFVVTIGMNISTEKGELYSIYFNFRMAGYLREKFIKRIKPVPRKLSVDYIKAACAVIDRTEVYLIPGQILSAGLGNTMVPIPEYANDLLLEKIKILAKDNGYEEIYELLTTFNHFPYM